MALERMQVTNHERWGNLVKTWSTGKNYLDDDNEYPIPTTIDEFKEQLAKAQVFMTVPDRFTKVKFVEQHMDTIVVRLPPAVAIADSEEKLSKPGATYPLPPFYKRLFNGIGSGDSGRREVQGACRAYRRLHDQLSVPERRSFALGGQYPRQEALRRANCRAGFPIAPSR